MKISHMKKDELFEGFYLIKSADLRQTRAGKNYLAFTFQDDSGEIEGKLWDAQPHNVEAFTAGKVVHMQGRREVYNNTPQVNQITLRLPQPGEPNDPADFKVKSPVDVKEIRDYMSQMILKLKILSGNDCPKSLTKYDKGNSTLIQLPRPTTMPLKPGLASTLQPTGAVLARCY